MSSHPTDIPYRAIALLVFHLFDFLQEQLCLFCTEQESDIACRLHDEVALRAALKEHGQILDRDALDRILCSAKRMSAVKSSTRFETSFFGHRAFGNGHHTPSLHCRTKNSNTMHISSRVHSMDLTGHRISAVLLWIRNPNVYVRFV